jgi:hypothetical protein
MIRLAQFAKPGQRIAASARGGQPWEGIGRVRTSPGDSDIARRRGHTLAGLFVILLSWHPDATRFVLPLTRKAGFRLAGLYPEGVEPSGSLRTVCQVGSFALSRDTRGRPNIAPGDFRHREGGTGNDGCRV